MMTREVHIPINESHHANYVNLFNEPLRSQNVPERILQEFRNHYKALNRSALNFLNFILQLDLKILQRKVLKSHDGFNQHLISHDYIEQFNRMQENVVVV